MFQFNQVLKDLKGVATAIAVLIASFIIAGGIYISAIAVANMIEKAVHKMAGG